MKLHPIIEHLRTLSDRDVRARLEEIANLYPADVDDEWGSSCDFMEETHQILQGEARP